MKLIAVSTANTASRNIGKVLQKKYELPKGVLLVEYDKSVLEADEVLKSVKEKPELLIVASSHKSEAGVNSLTTHTTGNWGKADAGGEEKTLSIAPSLYLRAALIELQRLKDERKIDYEVSLEATHHGPTVDVPVIFVEVGSGEKQYKDMKACEAAADVIYKLIKEDIEKVPVGVGFGGTHYATQFTKRVLDGKLAVGHICPKHACETLTEEMFLQAFEKTKPKPDFAVLDWKGLKAAEKHKIIEWCDKHGIYWRKVDEFK